MAIRPFNFYVEMEKNDYTPVGEVKQLDTMELDIKVLENSIPKNLESSEISLYVRKKDGTILEQKENISIVEASEGTIKIKVKNQATACAGMTLFELELKGADGIATTGTFIFVVNERVVNGEVVESKDEIHALVEVEKYVKLAKEELQRFKELQAEMLRTNETMNSQENLRNVAETERISAEEERKEKESERVESESNRVTAEGLRANAESSRANAENSRERKERERVTAEISRVDAEALRISEEKKRVNAENSRANSERSRIDAESVRVAEEKKRVTAETTRAENEDARVLAERNREENFSQFEDKINKISSDMSKNTKELKNARTATTGEEFNSLDERIDCEVDRINKKIEVSFLQQEDKENHLIENTVEGMTTDMVVKGRTLQNLCVLPNKDYVVIENTAYSLGKNFKPSTKYMLICDIKDSQSLEITDKTTYIRVDDKTGVVIGGYVGNVTNNYNRITFEFTTFENITGDLYLRQRLSLGTQQSIKNIVILEFDEIYKNIGYFEGIKSFGEAEGNKISILSSGKNLFNDSLFIGKDIELIKSEHPNFKQSIKLSEGDYCSQIEFTDGTKVMDANFILNGYNKKNTLVRSFLTNNLRNLSAEQANEIAYLRLVWNEQGLNSYRNKVIKNISLIKSDTIVNGEHYKEDKKDILLQDLGFDEGLRGIDNLTDELNYIRKVALKYIHKYTLTSESNWYIYDLTEDIRQFYIQPFEPLAVDDRNAINCISSTLPSCKYNDRTNLVNHIYCNANLLAVLKPKSTTLEEFKQWLRNNPTTVYYKLAEPVETPLSENINLKTFGEKTYVSFENAISGTSSFKAPVDTVLALSNLTDDIKNKTDKKEANEINERATESLELSEYNHSDINDNIFPYLMDLELMVLDMMELNGYTNKKYKISERAGIHMTSKQALERLIRQKKVTLEDALDRIVRYNDAGRITDAEALELTDLAHEIL